MCIRDRQVTVSERIQIAEETVCLTLVPSMGDELPLAQAGAHIDLYLAPGLVRQYSLTSCIQPGQYQIAVKLDQNSKGGSAYVHQQLRKDVNLSIGAPRNHFELQLLPTKAEAEQTVYLCAGGIGITPLLAMAWQLHLADRTFELHVFARTQSAVPFGKDFDTMPFSEKIFTHLDNDSETESSETVLSRMVNTCTESDQLYLCGPSGFMDLVKRQAIDAGIAESRVFTEHFSAEIDSQGETFTVFAKRSDITVEVQPQMSLLEALQAAGIAVPSACKNGVCGSCLLPVLEGKPDHRDLVQTDLEKSQNKFITACCSRSHTKKLVLDI